jgi:hypothetical protein
MTSGSINSSNPIANVYEPNGVEIFDGSSWSESNWNISKAGNNLTVTHPLNTPILMGSTTASNGSNLFTIPFVGKNASQLSIVNSVDDSTVKFNGITGINTGGSTGGTGYVIITFFIES